MSAKAKRRRKFKRASARSADARREEMRTRLAERQRIAEAVADGTATDQERAAHEAREKRSDEHRRMLKLIPDNVLYDGPMTWEAIHVHFGTGRGNA